MQLNNILQCFIDVQLSILHPASSILLPPSCFFHPASSILLLPSCFLHPASSILLLPSCFLHPASSILLLPSSSNVIIDFHFINRTSFENGFDIWSQLKNDTFDWTLMSGNTGSFDTGPTRDHTLQEEHGKYLHQFDFQISCYNVIK